MAKPPPPPGEARAEKERGWPGPRSPRAGDTPSLVARGGVEPPTFRFSVGRSYQLSYLAVMVICGPDGT